MALREPLLVVVGVALAVAWERAAALGAGLVAVVAAFLLGAAAFLAVFFVAGLLVVAFFAVGAVFVVFFAAGVAFAGVALRVAVLLTGAFAFAVAAFLAGAFLAGAGFALALCVVVLLCVVVFLLAAAGFFTAAFLGAGDLPAVFELLVVFALRVAVFWVAAFLLAVGRVVLLPAVLLAAERAVGLAPDLLLAAAVGFFFFALLPVAIFRNSLIIVSTRAIWPGERAGLPNPGRSLPPGPRFQLCLRPFGGSNSAIFDHTALAQALSP